MKKFFKSVALENTAVVVDFVLEQMKTHPIIFFEGEPGAGKTTFISELLKKHSLSGVSSPTFALHQSYSSGLTKFHHFDLYRVESVDELETVGLWECFRDASSGASKTQFIFIEWGSKFSNDIWPMDIQAIKVEIFWKTSDSRNYEISLFASG